MSGDPQRNAAANSSRSEPTWGQRWLPVYQSRWYSW
eukprot:CAMPEP_0198449502 /NCGR_PEP_ID=MMETSP1453-20131121/4339_1 /TAXON_ID=1461543 ORGANISM="Unidentified sp., Strain RCC701" /NCGR_SAMPLE_ID=MMETSP1453 /ASSEMBLY_ACC=CAM_ASM_001118 /LENGTH=35 /DNA_ID= /DNA_START= /DNA_END= /DNA_ORIENTATION=